MAQQTEQPLQARMVAIGVFQLNDHTEVRFVREPWGWRPDIVVNQATKEVSAAPPCFTPDPIVVAALDKAWRETVCDWWGKLPEAEVKAISPGS